MAFDGISDRWKVWRDRLPLDQYEARFAKLAAEGQNIHGEVDALDRLRNENSWATPTVFDAGCGTGRTALELASRGWSVSAADSDPDMIALATSKSVDIHWEHGDLTTIDLGQKFDVVLMAGNILLFVHEQTEAQILSNMAKHLEAGGLLIAGFALTEFTLAQYEQWCREAELALVQQWATWDGDPYEGGDYIVSIHRLATVQANETEDTKTTQVNA